MDWNDVLRIHVAGEQWCWSEGQDHQENEKELRFLSRYVEDHGEHFRQRYLDLIDQLGETVVQDRRVIEHLEIEPGFSFWWAGLLAEKSIYKSPRIQDSLKLLALSEILIREVPKRIVLEGGGDRSVEKAIRALCWELSVDVEVKAHRQIFQKRARFDSILGVGWLVRHLVKRWSLRGSSHPQWFGGNQTAFIFSYFIHLDQDCCNRGDFYSHQWEQFPLLLQERGIHINWLHHFLFSQQVSDTSQGVDWIEGFNSNSKTREQHGFLDHYLSVPVLIHALKLWIGLVRRSFRLHSVASCLDSGVKPFWPLLEEDWYGSFRGKVAMQNALWFGLMNRAFQEIPCQKSGYYLYEGQGWERVFLHIWRKHGHGELTAVQHATVRFWDLRYFQSQRGLLDSSVLSNPQPDRIAVNGPVAYQALREQGGAEEQLVMVEALRYMKIVSEFTPKFTPKRGEKKGALRLLVLGDILPSVTGQMLAMLALLPKETLASVDLVVKFHPGNIVDPKEFQNIHLKRVSDPLYQIVAGFDGVLAANPTSATLDAYLAGVPVSVFVPKGELNMSPLRGIQDVEFISSVEELDLSIQRCSAREPITQQKVFWLDQNLSMWAALLDKI